VLPILHLNGYKIDNPTVLARIGREQLEKFFEGCGYRPYFVVGDDPPRMHQLMAATLEHTVEEIRRFQAKARAKGSRARPAWPLIVLQTPKGWTGPKIVDGKQVEGTYRAHQVPLGEVRSNASHLAMLEQWMRSYRPQELFDEQGRLRAELAALAPEGARRMERQSTRKRRRTSTGPPLARFPRIRRTSAAAGWRGRGGVGGRDVGADDGTLDIAGSQGRQWLHVRGLVGEMRSAQLDGVS